MCIICQKEGGVFHNVETKPKGLKMFEVAKKIDDFKSLKAFLFV